MADQRRFSTGEAIVLALILALLTPLLLPLRHALQAAADEDAEHEAQTVCTDNLRRLSLAMIQYIQDYDEVYPAHNVYGSTTPLNWHAVLEPYLRDPYLKSPSAFECPRRESAPQYSYGFNYFYLDRQRASKVSLPASTVLFMDAGRRDDGGVVSKLYHINPPSQSTYANIVRPDWRHGQRFANVAYCDGHVKTSFPNDDIDGTYGTVYPTTAGAGGTWTGDPEHGPRRGQAPRVDAYWDTGRTWPGGP